MRHPDTHFSPVAPSGCVAHDVARPRRPGYDSWWTTPRLSVQVKSNDWVPSRAQPAAYLTSCRARSPLAPGSWMAVRAVASRALTLSALTLSALTLSALTLSALTLSAFTLRAAL